MCDCCGRYTSGNGLCGVFSIDRTNFLISQQLIDNALLLDNEFEEGGWSFDKIEDVDGLWDYLEQLMGQADITDYLVGQILVRQVQQSITECRPFLSIEQEDDCLKMRWVLSLPHLAFSSSALVT